MNPFIQVVSMFISVLVRCKSECTPACVSQVHIRSVLVKCTSMYMQDEGIDVTTSNFDCVFWDFGQRTE